jgi:hypothetical protein
MFDFLDDNKKFFKVMFVITAINVICITIVLIRDNI